MKPRKDNAINSWWFVRYRINWPNNASPSWNVDLLIAHKIVSPILQQQNKNFTLWRFHRRADRDSIGHEFSFIFYSSDKTAREIFKCLKYNTTLKEIKLAGVIIQDIYDDLSKANMPNIEDTSDPNWSSEIKKSWPYFIQGVCQMWLELVISISNQISRDSSQISIQKLLSLYSKVNKEIGELWREEGRHSLFHHLNAIFGYEPLKLNGGKMIRF